MSKKKVNVYFGKESLSEFLHLTIEIILKMTESASLFPNLPIPLAQITKEKDAYQKIYDSVEYVGRTGDLRNARKTLQDSLQRNGKYVNDVANGDLAILERSGYPIAKEHTPVGDLPAPEWMRVEVLPDGGFSFDVAIVRNYWGYLIAYTEASNPESNPSRWMMLWSPTSYAEFSQEFKSGVKYKFAACAVASSVKLSWIHGNKELFWQ